MGQVYAALHPGQVAGQLLRKKKGGGCQMEGGGGRKDWTDAVWEYEWRENGES